MFIDVPSHQSDSQLQEQHDIPTSNTEQQAVHITTHTHTHTHTYNTNDRKLK